MKTYVVMISRTFPATHPKKGEPTFFLEKLVGIKKYGSEKIHTIRANYDLWENRIAKVQDGSAELSLRYWSGKPYKSKQVELFRIGKDCGVGIQKVEFEATPKGFIGSSNIAYVAEIAKNDGLNLKDFKDWFKPYDLSASMAIIHFTKFRY